MNSTAQIIAAGGFAVLCIMLGVAAIIWARYEPGGPGQG